MLTYSFTAIPISVIIIYATLRGILSAVETPLRQAILPDLSDKISTTQAVSFHSFIINICRSIGPAIAGVILTDLSCANNISCTGNLLFYRSFIMFTTTF